MDLVVESFDPTRHDRGGFRCGEPSLDRYLAEQATQDIRRDVASLFCLVEPDRARVLGYYTLCAAGVRFADLPTELSRRLPRYPEIPAILLGRLAVREERQGDGLGWRLFGEAIQRSRATPIAAWCVLVDALQDRAATWYRDFGFTPLRDQPLRLVLPLKSVSPGR